MFHWPDETIFEGVQTVAEREQSRTALVWQGQSTTYGELVEESRRLARGLTDFGVGTGDTVAVWLRNRPAWIESQLAASALGAAVVAVNTRYRTHELKYLLDDADVRVLVTESSFLGTDYLDVVASFVPALRESTASELGAESVPALDHVIAVDGADDYPGAHEYEAVKRTAEGDEPLSSADAADEPACVFYTSGTTSDPKGCPQTNRSLLEHSTRVADHFDLGPKDIALGVLPFCGVMGHNVFLSALAQGIPLVVQSHFDAETSLNLIETHGVTYFSGMGTMYERLIDADSFDPDRVDSLTKGAVAFINGLDEDTFDRIEVAVDFPIVQPYGLSEGNSQIFVGDPADPRDRRVRVGGPLVFPEEEEAQVADPETGDPVEPDEQGELLLRGFNVIDEYLDKPEETAAAFDDDGWFHTGDLAEADDDGYLYYHARMDDALRVRGFLVAPMEIEAAVVAHPQVEAAEVVGVSHNRHGQVPVAFIIAVDGVDKSSIRDFLDGRLADYKIPAAVYVVDEFPRTEGPHGKKVQKHTLRELATQRFEV